MISDDSMVKVQNLTDGKLVYSIPETNIRREFNGQQIREISAKELRDLYATRGGKTLIEDYLSVKSVELAKEFNISDDSFSNEYNWTEKDVDTVLRYGSLDKLKDALDFAPQGIIQLIVSRAVALRIPDNNKLAAIYDSTGYNVAEMINLDKEMEKENNTNKEEKPKGRRVSSTANETKAETGRRVG